MRKLLILLFLSFTSICISAQYIVTGGIGEPYAYSEDLAGAGVEKVYLFNTLNGATISYTSSAASVKFYRYKQSLADKEEVSTSRDGTIYTVSDLEDGYGYLVSEGESVRAAVWIIDYSMHQPVLTSIEVVESEDKCDFLKLFVTKSENELFFYTNSGVKRNIRRTYTLDYVNKVWNDTEKKFEQKNLSTAEQETGTDIIIDAPLMDTHFTLKGDQFAKHFNITKEVSTAIYAAIAVEAHIFPEQQKRDANNETGNEEGLLGGSAPVVIDFYGYGNEPVAGYYTWFIYNKQDMQNPIARYTDKDIKYTFEAWGDYIVKLEVADQSSMCTDTTSVSFSISESWIDAPNFFSPGDSPGSNDEFKVAYKSIVKFKCTVFNRWGTKLYQWTDPSKGWDGRYKGSYVTTGVYFYVIEATGSDGKRYKLGGDINVFRSR
ncbi:MAG: gliding motility-associated C-terminal domain-containing protein [Dysgonomonas sp.]